MAKEKGAEESKVSRRDFVKGTVTGLVVGAVATGAGAAAMWPPAAPPPGVVTQTVTQAAQTVTVTAAGPRPFEGKRVTLALHAGMYDVAIRDWYSGPIKDGLGVDIAVVGIPVTQLFDKELLELSTGTGAYDILQFSPAWMGDYADYLQPLDDYMQKEDPLWGDIHVGFRDWENTYGGKVYSLTWDGDVILLYYRKDLFEDQNEKAAFKAKYGYDLAPPQTWDQYNDIAEFFKRDRNGDGQIDLWGCAEQGKRGRQFYWYMLRYIAYSSPDPHLFDPTNMKPLINSPNARAALESYKRSIDLSPPGVLGFEWDELFAAFINGSVAMICHWPDEGKRYDELRDPLAKNPQMGYGVPPGIIKNGVLYRRSMTFGGWLLGITKASKNPDAAYAVLRYLVSPEVSWVLCVGRTRAELKDAPLDFFRYSHFAHPMIGPLGLHKEYMDTFAECIRLLYPELRIPGGGRYNDILDLHTARFLAGEIGAKEALDTVAKEWDGITDELGRDSQLKKYREAMGLPPL